MTTPALQTRMTTALMWFTFFASGLIVAIWLAWMIMATVDFGFAAGYRLLAIDSHIQTFGPQNRYRQDFASTDTSEHLRLFGEIVTAIHSSGKGLAEITYPLPGGGGSTLMREPEVIHLQDVANLIDRFYTAAWVCLVIWLLCSALLYHRGARMPGWRATGLGLLGLVLMCLLVVFAVGPKALFYWLHIQLFPPEHEWFFYYQDSLMTTLMKAPDIFGFISALIALLALLIYAAALWGTKRLLQQRRA